MPVALDAISQRTSVTASLPDEGDVVDKDAALAPTKADIRSAEREEAEIGMPVGGKRQKSRFASFMSYPLRRRRWLIPGLLSALCIGGAFPLSGA